MLLSLTIIASAIFASAKVCKNKQYTTAPPCPTDTTWYVSTNYPNRLRCFGLNAIPKNLTTPTQLTQVCKSKHADALPASFHNVNELIFCSQKAMEGGVTGLYLPSGKTFAAGNFKNLDGMAADYLPFNTSGGTTSTNTFILGSQKLAATAFTPFITTQNANLICAMWAT
uniref:C-type lectin domain-containing protein n=1 Tax=Panagrellus redivivus TaxID=6233 RepID=A0A7E4VV30_PANRE